MISPNDDTSDIASHSVTLAIIGYRLRFESASAIPNELFPQMKAKKAELLEAVRGQRYWHSLIWNEIGDCETPEKLDWLAKDIRQEIRDNELLRPMDDEIRELIDSRYALIREKLNVIYEQCRQLEENKNINTTSQENVAVANQASKTLIQSRPRTPISCRQITAAGCDADRRKLKS